MKMILKIECFIVLSILSRIGLSNQCPPGQEDNTLKSLTYYNPSSVTDKTYIFDIEHDDITGEFFYIGVVEGGSNVTFLSKTDNEGNHNWINTFANPVPRYVLTYSSTLQTVYHTLINSTNFIILRWNSTTGAYLESYTIGSIYQDTVYFSCSMDSSEQSIFCNVASASNQFGIVVFRPVTLAFYIVYYPSDYTPSRDIIAINNLELFYHCEDTTNNLFHFIKSRLNRTSNQIVEEYHQTMNGPTGVNPAMSKVDENNATIWHAVANGDIVYFQHNLTDFSLIGSQYENAGSITNERINGLDVYDDTVFIMFQANTDYMFMRVNATTQNVIQLYVFETTTIQFGVFGYQGYVNIIVAKVSSTTRSEHIQIVSSFNQTDLPSINTSNLLTFSTTTSSQQALTTQSNTNHTAHSVPSTVFSSLSFAARSFVLLQNESYIISMPHSFQYNVTVSENQNATQSIDLPCSLNSYSSQFLSHSVYDNGVDPIPSWVAPDYSNSTLTIQAPTVNQSEDHVFMIESTYPEGSIINYFYITVTSCNIANCILCNQNTCDTCMSGYQVSNDSNSCVIVEQSIEQSSNTTNLDSNYYTTRATLSSQLLSVVGILASFIGSFINRKPPQSAWSIINSMQMILLLPAMAKYMTSALQDFILSYRFSIISLNFKLIYHFDSWQIAFDQDNEYLNRLGMDSGSTLVNNFGFVICLVTLLLFHLLVFIVMKCTKSCKNSFHKLILKLFNFMTFTIYIRIFVETIMFLMMEASFEIKRYFIYSKGNIFSLVAAFIFVLLCTAFVIVSIVSWVCTLNITKMNHRVYTREFYSGIKECDKNQIVPIDEDHKVSSKIRVARLYMTISLLRRLLVVILIKYMDVSLYHAKISILIFIQILCLIHIIIVRSFESKADQICEIVNEVIYFCAMIPLIYLTDRNKWNMQYEYAFIGLLLLNMLFLALVSVIKTIVEIYLCLKHLCFKGEKEYGVGSTKTEERVNKPHNETIQISSQGVSRLSNIHNLDYSKMKIIRIYRDEESKVADIGLHINDL